MLSVITKTPPGLRILAASVISALVAYSGHSWITNANETISTELSAIFVSSPFPCTQLLRSLPGSPTSLCFATASMYGERSRPTILDFWNASEMYLVLIPTEHPTSTIVSGSLP